MKTTLRIFRILCKLLLLAYVTIVNFVFITVFYALLLSILRHIWPAYIPGINKYTEYRCDAYAVEYGCGEGLLSFLRRLKRMEDVYGERLTFTEYIMSTHPSTEKRIARLEKQL